MKITVEYDLTVEADRISYLHAIHARRLGNFQETMLVGLRTLIKYNDDLSEEIHDILWDLREKACEECPAIIHMELDDIL